MPIDVKARRSRLFPWFRLQEVVLPLLLMCLACNPMPEHPSPKPATIISENRSSSRPDEPLLNPSEFNTGGICPGDIILKKGRGPLSSMIVEAMHEKVPFSHCGIFVKNADSLCIAHAVSKRYGHRDGVQLIGIHAFLNDCVKNHTYVVRYKGDRVSREQFAINALRYAGARIPFDINTDNRDSSAMSCAELLYHATQNAHDIKWTEIKVRNTTWLGFAGLIDSAVFTTIMIR